MPSSKTNSLDAIILNYLTEEETLDLNVITSKYYFNPADIVISIRRLEILKLVEYRHPGYLVRSTDFMRQCVRFRRHVFQRDLAWKKRTPKLDGRLSDK